MARRVSFSPKVSCPCPISRIGFAGAIIHHLPCQMAGKTEWLAQSGDVIEVGKRYRWINNDDEWSKTRGYKEINVVATVTKINDAGMVFAYWHEDDPESDQYGMETSIPNSAVVELVLR